MAFGLMQAVEHLTDRLFMLKPKLTEGVIEL